MNWINNIRPKIRSLLTTKRDLPENLWVKCPDTGQMVFYKDLEANQFVIPGSNHHMRMDAHKRLQHIFDGVLVGDALPDELLERRVKFLPDALGRHDRHTQHPFSTSGAARPACCRAHPQDSSARPTHLLRCWKLRSPP